MTESTSAVKKAIKEYSIVHNLSIPKSAIDSAKSFIYNRYAIAIFSFDNEVFLQSAGAGMIPFSFFSAILNHAKKMNYRAFHFRADKKYRYDFLKRLEAGNNAKIQKITRENEQGAKWVVVFDSGVVDFERKARLARVDTLYNQKLKKDPSGGRLVLDFLQAVGFMIGAFVDIMKFNNLKKTHDFIRALARVEVETQLLKRYSDIDTKIAIDDFIDKNIE